MYDSESMTVTSEDSVALVYDILLYMQAGMCSDQQPEMATDQRDLQPETKIDFVCPKI